MIDFNKDLRISRWPFSGSMLNFRGVQLVRNELIAAKPAFWWHSMISCLVHRDPYQWLMKWSLIYFGNRPHLATVAKYRLVYRSYSGTTGDRRVSVLKSGHVPALNSRHVPFFLPNDLEISSNDLRKTKGTIRSIWFISHINVYISPSWKI